MAGLIWITGLSGSGKTTIGRKVYALLKASHANAVFLDGDTIRDILGHDLGHDLEARRKNALRIHRMCRFLVAQDIHVVCATMSLFHEVHALNRQHVANYLEVWIECEMEELNRRDRKGLYSRALQGEISNVVGVDLPYERPHSPDLVVNNTAMEKVDEKARKILSGYLKIMCKGA